MLTTALLDHLAFQHKVKFNFLHGPDTHTVRRETFVTQKCRSENKSRVSTRCRALSSLCSHSLALDDGWWWWWWTSRPLSTPDVKESNPSSQVTAARVTHKSPGRPADESGCDRRRCSQSTTIRVSITLMSAPPRQTPAAAVSPTDQRLAEAVKRSRVESCTSAP